MSVTLAELDRFHAFAQSKLGNGGAESLQELVDLWLAESPDVKELEASLAALREGLADADAGRVRPARDVFEDLATRYSVDLPE
jgi:hypothetical protein